MALVTRAEEYCLLEWKARQQRQVGGTDAGLVGLHRKGALAGQSVTTSRNELTLGGAVAPQE